MLEIKRQMSLISLTEKPTKVNTRETLKVKQVSGAHAAFGVRRVPQRAACRVCPIKACAACGTVATGVRHVPRHAASYTKDVRGQAALCGCKQKMPRRL